MSFKRLTVAFGNGLQNNLALTEYACIVLLVEYNETASLYAEKHLEKTCF